MLNLFAGCFREDMCGPFSVSLDNAELLPRQNRIETKIWSDLSYATENTVRGEGLSVKGLKP